jgi:hypothetical protein
VSIDPFAPAIVGQVPVTFGRYWADGLVPPPPVIDPDVPVEPVDAPLAPPELDPELFVPEELPLV